MSPYLQGRPKTARGNKALSLFLAYTYQNFRPGGGLKVHGGSVILELGLGKDDFAEMHEAGIRIVAEIGGSGITDPKEVDPMLKWVRDLGWVVPVHFGPKSVPASSSLLTAESVLCYDPDVIVHVNGGSTAAPWDEIEKTITQSKVNLEVIFAGNPAISHRVVRRLKERGEFTPIGSDTPTSHGVVPIAMLRMVYEISSMIDIPPAHAWAFATGNVANAYKLDVGRIRPGAPADLVVMHTPIDAPVTTTRLPRARRSSVNHDGYGRWTDHHGARPQHAIFVAESTHREIFRATVSSRHRRSASSAVIPGRVGVRSFDLATCRPATRNPGGSDWRVTAALVWARRGPRTERLEAPVRRTKRCGRDPH